LLKRICILLLLLYPLAAVAAQDVTIKGKDCYRDGKRGLPKGVQIEGLNRPFGTDESVTSQASVTQGRSWCVAESETGAEEGSKIGYTTCDTR
jgi:hypothetical protein